MKKLLLFLVIFLAGNLVIGQLKVVSGRVTGFQEFPFQNIVVKAKNTKTTAKTDEYGEFKILCNPNDVLIFESKSCFTVKYKVKNQEDSVIVNLEFKNTKKSREYAIAYGIISEENLTYAISNLSTKNNNYDSYNNMYDLIIARFPGVYVVGNNIIIRGSGSNGDCNALLIVDNMPVNDLQYLNPSDVASIDVLKDASTSIYGARLNSSSQYRRTGCVQKDASASIYSTRGANGAVIISTHKSKP